MSTFLLRMIQWLLDIFCFLVFKNEMDKEMVAPNTLSLSPSLPLSLPLSLTIHPCVFRRHFICCFLQWLTWESRGLLGKTSEVEIVFSKIALSLVASQWTFTCSKLTTEILEQGVKYVQS